MARASTKLSFFQSYDFEIDEESSLYAEFERLAGARNWKPGSNRRPYEKAWRECFGNHAPVGINPDEKKTNGQKEDEYDQMLHGLKNIDLGGKHRARAPELRRIAQQFTTYYGMDDQALESWQELCVDCGIDEELDSITKCKKALRQIHVNIYDLVRAKERQEKVVQYGSRRELVSDLRKHPHRRYPLEAAKENRLMRAFLTHL